MSNDHPMTNLDENDYCKLVNQMQEQLVMLIKQDVFKPSELRKTIRSVVSNEWSPRITVQQWFAKAAFRLGIDCCVEA